MEKKANLLLEQINLTNEILEEAKKIGIEKLPYSDASLQRFIDSKTMDIHYNKHYKGYVKKLNNALAKENFGDLELEDIITSISKYNTTIRNNAGGAFNHALFWKMLSPKKQDIPNNLKKEIIDNFGSVNNFKKVFEEESKNRFGSGWCWLVLTKGKKLKVMTTPNQDNPLMNIVKNGGFPILGLDLWEHAYYLKYQNKRDEYIKNFWDVVNWNFVNELYELKTNKKEKLSESRVFLKKELLKLIKENDTKEVAKDNLVELCNKKTRVPGDYVPYCKLQKYRDNLTNQIVKDEINKNFDIVYNFYGRKPNKIMNMIFLEMFKPTSSVPAEIFLSTLTKIIKSPKYLKGKLRKRLVDVSREENFGEKFETLLADIETSASAQYEASFEGDEFDIKQTRLKLEYSCSEENVGTLINYIQDFEAGTKNYQTYLDSITKCMKQTFDAEDPQLKADIVTKKPLKVIDLSGKTTELYPANTHFEVKKMRETRDSFLSEFFSIFKQGSIKDVEPRYAARYNQLMDDLYLFAEKNGEGFLQKIASQMAGIAFNEYILVPIKYIELYWSNKGQKSCSERRLSIRFRLKPINGQIETYIYTKGSDILELNSITFSKTLLNKFQQKVICPI